MTREPDRRRHLGRLLYPQEALLGLRLLDLLKDHLPGVSFMTVAELYCWPFRRNWSDRRIVELRQFLEGYAVLRHSEPINWEWAKIKCRRGRPIADSDAWIAATAVFYGAPLVTHNPRHFLHVEGLKVLTVSS